MIYLIDFTAIIQSNPTYSVRFIIWLSMYASMMKWQEMRMMDGAETLHCKIICILVITHSLLSVQCCVSPSQLWSILFVFVFVFTNNFPLGTNKLFWMIDWLVDWLIFFPPLYGFFVTKNVLKLSSAWPSVAMATPSIWDWWCIRKACCSLNQRNCLLCSVAFVLAAAGPHVSHQI